MDSKFIEYLEKTGQKDIATLLSNSADKAPDEFDVDKIAHDYLDSRAAIYKSSEDFKSLIKEQRIVAEKEINKHYNDALGLGLTKEEAGKLGRDEIAKIIKDKHDLQIKESQNGHTKEWQEKYNHSIAESSKLKKMLEETETTYKKQLEEANGRYETKILQDKKDKAFTKAFEPEEWIVDGEVARVFILNKCAEKDIKWDENGRPYTGENGPVLADDGVTVLETLPKIIKSIGRPLLPQANPGNHPGGGIPAQPAFTPSGNAQLDSYVQQQIQRNLELNKGNF